MEPAARASVRLRAEGSTLMLVAANQRWRDRRSSYRPAGETIRTADYEVAPLPTDREARAFVVAHHYSGSYPAARFRLGLFRADELVGVAVFSVPVNARTLDVLPGGRANGVELGRFVLLDSVPGNGETWFLGRAFELLRRDGVDGVVSFSDPMPRADAAGRVVMPGHVGTIYQAHNACYLGQARRDTMRLLPDGRALCNRAAAKIRARDRGYPPFARLLAKLGAEPLLPEEDSAAWLARWLPRLTRAVRHPGNHKYAWALDPRLRRHLPKSKPYPKLGASPVDGRRSAA